MKESIKNFNLPLIRSAGFVRLFQGFKRIHGYVDGCRHRKTISKRRKTMFNVEKRSLMSKKTISKRRKTMLNV